MELFESMKDTKVFDTRFLNDDGELKSTNYQEKLINYKSF